MDGMSAFSMQLLGSILIGAGVLFFLFSQILLSKWARGFRSESMSW